ncbi:MAG: alkaline phosphatase [Thermoanaerobaculales bacterium]
MCARRCVMGTVLMAVFAAVVVIATPVAAHDFFPQSVASGDPRPDSVVLWTRVDALTDEEPKALLLEVADDAGFSNIVVTRELSAWALNDYCVKVQVGGLESYRNYYYRFTYDEEVSPAGRTRTAPDPASAQPVRFAVVYGQDFTGRYYNPYLELLNEHDEDIDFVVHLGDYVYETTGDPSFQDPSEERKVVFEDIEGAIPLGSPENRYYAAASLANYRTLYRTFRSDEMLRRMHERWPMIVIWDDHEYSNDCWGATATYSSGRVDEFDEQRRRNAEQAFYEWIPTEAGLGDDGLLTIDDSNLYPNSGIYRDFMFGSLVHLVLSDYRTFRPDHLVAEDAFPGAIAVDQDGLIQLLSEPVFEAVKSNFDPYVDMDLLGAFLPILRQTATLIASQAYMMENPALDTFAAVRLAEEMLEGNQSTSFINALYAAADLPPPFTPDIQAMLPCGISYLYIGKTAMYSSTGSRSQVMLDTFNLYAAHRYLETGGAAQEAFGGVQNAWLQGTLLGSPATWKVLVNSVMMTPLVIDFTNPVIAAMLPPDFPDLLRVRLGLSAEDFNGFPQKRTELITLLGMVENAMVLSGDIHASFVTDHGEGVYEFTGAAISSSSYAEMVQNAIASDPILGQIPGLEELLANFDALLQISSLDDEHVSPSDIVYADTDVDAFVVVEATADVFEVEIHEISTEHVSTSFYDSPDDLADLFTTTTFTVQNGELSQGP